MSHSLDHVLAGVVAGNAASNTGKEPWRAERAQLGSHRFIVLGLKARASPTYTLTIVTSTSPPLSPKPRKALGGLHIVAFVPFVLPNPG